MAGRVWWWVSPAAAWSCGAPPVCTWFINNLLVLRGHNLTSLAVRVAAVQHLRAGRHAIKYPIGAGPTRATGSDPATADRDVAPHPQLRSHD